MTMRAVIAARAGGPEVLTVAEVPVPVVGPDQVLVRVRAAALNHADLYQRAGEFPPPPGETEVLGVEVAGEVVARGANVTLALGTPVFGLCGGGGYADYCLLDAEMAIPFGVRRPSPPLSNSVASSRQACEYESGGDGLRTPYTDAEAAPPRSAGFQPAATPASSRHASREIPGRLEAGVAAGWEAGAPCSGVGRFTYAEAAALPEVFFTADTTLFQLGNLREGQTVLIHGGGSGLGTACIQMAKSVGARVACTVGSEDKKQRALALGADLAINYKTDDFVAAVQNWTNGEGVDLIEDIVGADYFDRNLAALKEGGTLLLVGVQGGTRCELDLDAILLKRLQVKGSVMRPLPIEAKRAIARRFRERWLPLLASGQLTPVVDSIIPLHDVAKAHERMERSEHFGKIILDIHKAQELPMNQQTEGLLDISNYDVILGGPDAIQTGELPDRIARLLTEDTGYCVLYGTNKVLARHGMDIRADRAAAYDLLESVFKSAMARIDMLRFSVTPRPMTFAKMDVDGYNLNQNFSHDGSIASRAFMTSKLLHFDAATPFIGNIYGPNDNIAGGHPVICDVKRFCRERGVPARELVEPIPNNYNVAIRREHYEDLKDNYSFGLDINLEGDIVIVMLLNEIDFGVAHGATSPGKAVDDLPARRPIRHFEYQYAEEEHYAEWYGHYALEMLSATDYSGENLSLEYHEPARHPFENLIRVDN